MRPLGLTQTALANASLAPQGIYRFVPWSGT